MEYLTSDSDEFGTPNTLFNKQHYTYSFTVDVAASNKNAKLDKYYTKETDGLKQSWRGERVWCNPPYSRGAMLPFILKGIEEIKENGCELAVYLIPARVEQSWFHELILPYMYSKNTSIRLPYHTDVEFVRNRVKFIGGKTSARHASMFVKIFNPNYFESF